MTIPNIRFTQFGESLGIKSTRVTTAGEFETQYADVVNTRGPRSIDAII